MAKLSLLQLLVAAAALTQAAPTAPQERAVSFQAQASEVKITPGPGLPSLESLGLTVEDLLDPDFQAKHAAKNTSRNPAVEARQNIVKRFDAYCFVPGGNRGGARACLNYLTSLGTTTCLTTGYSAMCTANYNSLDTVIVGYTAYGVTSASSSCSAVAQGGQYVLDNCSNGSTSDTAIAGGENAAFGNGNLLVAVQGTFYG